MRRCLGPPKHCQRGETRALVSVPGKTSTSLMKNCPLDSAHARDRMTAFEHKLRRQ